MFLLLSSVAYFFSINEADNDLWGHVLFGQQILARGMVGKVDTYSYTVAGQPWMNHEWLSQAILGAVFEWAGSPGLLVLKFVVATLTFLLLFSMIRRRSGAPFIWGGVGLLAIAVLARGFAIRPQVFTYCGAALTLWLIDRYRCGHERALVFFPLLSVVWANMHGGFILGLGILGYHVIAGFNWVDSLLNAAMILAGMGPVGVLNSDAAKLFASAYALFSGIVFLATSGVLLAPFLHRLMHRFHLESR